MDRYRITYWHWGRSADKQRRIPTHVRYIDASWYWWTSSAERSGISISLCPRVFWHWSLLDRRKSLHSLSRCLWCTRITILSSSNSSWVRFKKVISSPGLDMSSMEIAYFDCSEGTSCFITASRLPTMSKSSTWTIKKQSPCLLLSMLGCASSSVISSEHSLLGQLCQVFVPKQASHLSARARHGPSCTAQSFHWHLCMSLECPPLVSQWEGRPWSQLMP